MFVGPGKPLPVRDLYGIFRRRATAADIAVAAVARDDGYEDDELGRPLYDQTRLLFGTRTQGVYALPTSTDAVCVSNFPNGGAGCGEPGPHGLTVDFDEASGQTPFVLYGLVGDDVQSVDFVFADGGLRHAEVRENAYYVQMPGQQTDPDRFILHLRNGVSDVLPSGGTVGLSTITPIP
jgi:hypothetical protein